MCLSQRFSQLIIKVDSPLFANTVSFMSELLKYFSGGIHLDQLDVATLIDYVATV